MSYTPKTFTIPELAGISKESIDLHLGLYAGYVKHVNLIHEKIAAYKYEAEINGYAIAEMQRRLGFEFGGMKNHETYFEQLEGGFTSLPEGAFKDALGSEYGSLVGFMAHFRTIALTRGVGWAMLYFDTEAKRLVATWVDEQHLGQLPGLDLVLALDMWEHSYMRDYVPADKGKYIDAFFANLNWEVVASRAR
jgi:superoxide dismutase, Fe-Mn family